MLEVDLTKRNRFAAALLLGSLVAQSLFCPVPALADSTDSSDAPIPSTAISAPAETVTPAAAATPAATTPAAIIPAAAITPAATTTAAAIGTTGAALALTTTPAGAVLTAAAAMATVAPVAESAWYSARNPMPKAHQQLLHEFCRKNGIGYLDMLALIGTESGFNEKCVSVKKYYGYFQIGKGHFADLAASLKTKNAPLDGAVNIQWGTAMFGWIMADPRVTKLPAEKRLDAALSIYQRGPIGYDRYGVNKKFLARFYKKRAMVAAWYGKQQEKR